ncbi:hypothetical protein CLIB1423_04S04412 [[Candida] railenensis]|uniref:TORC1 subunit TCO89 n=1 Tax=[Candida] railenensis TaxID=45579 RepID=A0A9P0QNP0_9ASCO|nr:hypothetical protein CLIB1423_04S04412 [[Candida] railenensis]
MSLGPSELPSDRSSSTLTPQDPRGRPKMPPLGSYSTSSITQSKLKRINSGGNNTSSGNSTSGGNKPSHGRSLSHILASSSKNSNSLHRPSLARSKSTDGLTGKNKSTDKNGVALKRNNRSLTKLTGLNPLTKSNSNQSIKSNKSNSSLKGLNMSTLSGLKSSSKKEKAILRLNEDNDDDDEYEDTGSPPEESKEEIRQSSNTSAIAKVEEEPHEHSNGGYSFQSSNDDLSNNIYGGSLYLSQSTGLTKKINGNDTSNNNIAGRLAPIESENISGISFNANPMDSSVRKVAEPITTTKTVETMNSYQPNQSIFNNLQRKGQKSGNTSSGNKGGDNFQNFLKSGNGADSSSSSTGSASGATGTASAGNSSAVGSGSNAGAGSRSGSKAGASTSVGNGAGNGSSGVAGPSSHHENRTQQRLWLQRENSLMDVSNIEPKNLGNFSSLSLNNLMFSHQGHVDLSQLAMSQNVVTPGGNAGNGPTSSGPMGSGPVGPTTPGVAGGDSQTSLYGLLLNIQTSSQNSIQSRTEFERLNREYLNVRRNLNPVGESLNRTQEYFKSSSINQKVIKSRNQKNKLPPASQSASSSTSSSSTPGAAGGKDFTSSFHEREADISTLVNKIWQEALISNSTQSQQSPLRISTQIAQQQQQQQQQQPLQQLQSIQQSQQSQFGQPISGPGHSPLQSRPANQRLQSYTQSNYSNLRNPQTPTTRAVKLASVSQQSFKKNDHSVNLA